MSRWTKARDRARSVASGVIRKPLTDIKYSAEIIAHPTRLAPSYVLKQDYATSLDKLALGEGVSDMRAVRNTGRIVGAAIGLFYGGSAVYSAAGGGATGAVEVGIPGTDVGVAAGSSGGAGLIGGGSGVATSTGILGTGVTAGDVSTTALVLNALRRGNVGAAVDALTGSDWGSQYLPNFGGGTDAGVRSGGLPDSGSPSAYARGGMSPLVLAALGIAFVIVIIFIVRKIHHA